MNLSETINREQNEAKLSDQDAYSQETIGRLQQENIRLYMEVKRLTVLYKFNRDMNEIYCQLITDLMDAKHDVVKI